MEPSDGRRTDACVRGSETELLLAFHRGPADDELEGSGEGVMLSDGGPRAGEAGYAAMETVRGRLGGRRVGFALQQFGTMAPGRRRSATRSSPDPGQGS